MRDLSELHINEGGRPVDRPAPSPDLISEFQAHFGITLPDNYLALLMYSNGGHPETSSVQGAGEKPTSWAIDTLYHLDQDRTSYESLWVAMKYWRPILGEGAFPFAQDGGGNQFFLDLTRSPAPVKMCIHDERFRVLELSPSFEAFIDALSVDADMI